jgi:hypothetical protein
MQILDETIISSLGVNIQRKYMPTDKENFTLRFIPKTPQQVKKEMILE